MPPLALITGASSGIGLELARLLAADGYSLVLHGRDRGRLEALGRELGSMPGGPPRIITKELGEPGAAGGLWRELGDDAARLEVLVNNAGFGVAGRFAATDLEAELRLLETNIVALTHLTKLALRSMLAAGRGRILNVASTAAFQPGPGMAVYYASKAYVLSFTEALHEELRGSRVTVTALCPGPTRTGFGKAAGMGETILFRSPMVLDAAPVARAGYRGMLAGKRLVIPGRLNSLLAFSVRFSPRGLVLKFAKRIQESRAPAKAR